MVKNIRVFTLQPLPLTKGEVHAIAAFLKRHFHLRVFSLEISFVSGNELLEINRKHLQHDYRTDIITFGYSDDLNCIDGELIISVDDAAQNASKYGITLKEEYIRLIVHGMLHLIGYNDILADEKVQMELTQEMLIKDIIVHLSNRKENR